MRKTNYRVMVIFAAMWCSIVARADILIVSGQGNTIMPRTSTEVSMDSETVVVESEDNAFNVKAEFVMNNRTALPVKARVGFPVVDRRYDYHMKRSFKAEIRSGDDPSGGFTPATCELEMRPKTPATGVPWEDARVEGERLNYPGFIVWDVSWAAHEKKIIRVSYDMGEMPYWNGLVSGCSLSYVVRTGALWQGPIGKADITIRFKEGFSQAVFASGKKRITSFPENARWVNPNEITWHFENWKPTEDIWVKSLTWSGVSEKSIEDWDFFVLRRPYQGNEIQYTDLMLEQWVDGELDPWRAFFPEEIAKIDRRLYKQIIADWLYHELYARNGDPFFIGLHVDGQPNPPGARGYMEHDKSCIGRWRDHFDRYGGMKGWYQPKALKDGKPPKIKLSPTEQKNADFLKSYLDTTSR